MKRKLYLIMVLLLVLAVTGGIYAYTWNTATATIDTPEPTGDIATYETAPDQPNWYSILDALVGYGPCEYGEWEYWPGSGNSIELEETSYECYIMTQGLLKLELEECHHTSIILQGYVDGIVIENCEYINIWAEQDYGYLVMLGSNDINVEIGPGPPPPTEGLVPIGKLFVITPHPDYTGDLTVRVYLLNTADLIKVYEELDMELTLKDAEENPQLFTLHNGVASFALKDCASGTHTLYVTGGTYSLVSNDPSEWQEGWTVVPELYCEVTQR